VSSDVINASLTLMASARELDELSKTLTGVERELEPLETELSTWVEDFHAACWERHVMEEAKLPSSEIRVALAHKAFDREKYTRVLTLTAARNRGKRRISDLKGVVDAQRSIVSALKTEMEAAEGPQPQWSNQQS
jgi:hypothetical protein